MNLLKKILIIFCFTSLLTQTTLADVPFYLDFKYILNSSIAGKKAQDSLKKKLQNGISSPKKRKTNSGGRKKLIQQKK